MKKLLLIAALLNAPMAVSAEIVVLSDQTIQRECTVPRGGCTEYYRVTTFYDTVSGMFCVDQAESLQCIPASQLSSARYRQIRDLVEEGGAKAAGN